MPDVGGFGPEHPLWVVTPRPKERMIAGPSMVPGVPLFLSLVGLPEESLSGFGGMVGAVAVIEFLTWRKDHGVPEGEISCETNACAGPPVVMSDGVSVCCRRYDEGRCVCILELSIYWEMRHFYPVLWIIAVGISRLLSLVLSRNNEASLS
jgi:hypothetical protein